MEVIDKVLVAFYAWLEYTVTQIGDISFWWGMFTAVAAVVGALLFPAFRGAVAPLTNFISKLGNGYYHYWKGEYPDIISGTGHILMMHDGKTLFYLDSIFGEKLLSVVVGNPYKTFLLRQTAQFAAKADPLIRLNHYGGVKNRWWHCRRIRKRLRSRKYSEWKASVKRRYRSHYRPLVAYISEHYTNAGSIRAVRGEEMVVMEMVIAKTYMGNEKHHRLHIIPKWVLEDWPDETPILARPEYAERHELTVWLRRMFKRYPWRFDIIHDYIPLGRIPEEYASWLKKQPLEYRMRLGYSHIAE